MNEVTAIPGETGHVERPFYFFVPFWGAAYRNYFVNYCLPSLLAPNNLPLLDAKDGHRLLIATTTKDWDAIKNLPVLEKVRRHVEPVLVEIEAPKQAAGPGSDSALHHHTQCHKKLVKMAFEARAYGSQLFPDLVFSDGMVASLRWHVHAGTRVVLYAALRQTEETVAAELVMRGIINRKTHLSSGAAINLSPRQTIDLAIRHLHPEVLIFEAGHPEQPLIPQHQFWRISGGRGLIVRTLYGVPALLDYGAISDHDVSCLDEDIFEESYVRRNFYLFGGIHVVQDSDEFSVMSLTPGAIQRVASPESRSQVEKWYARHYRTRAAMSYHVRSARNPLKRDIFRHSIRWHIGDIDRIWNQEEKKIETTIMSGVGDYFRGAERHGHDYFPGRLSFHPLRLPADLLTMARPKMMSAERYYVMAVAAKYHAYTVIVLRAMVGHTPSMARIYQSIRRRISASLDRFPNFKRTLKAGMRKVTGRGSVL